MAKLKEAARWFSDAIETACGWALLALTLYALIFMDLTGNGSAWNSLRGVARDAAPVTRVSVVPHEDAGGRDRMLIASSGQEQSTPAAAQRPAAAMTDAPAERASKGDWKAHLTGKLRSFVVYGQGEQTTSASVSASPSSSGVGASSSQSPAAAPTPAVPGSAYRAGASAVARPGIGARVSNVASGPADSVRNFK